MEIYGPNELPQRREYVAGGFGGLRHIVINYHKDGSVTRTINGKNEYYATQNDFHTVCELAYNDYIQWLDETKFKRREQ